MLFSVLGDYFGYLIMLFSVLGYYWCFCFYWMS